MQRESFFVKEHVLANMSFLSYSHVSRCARHALEPTDNRLMYADDMICAVSLHSVVAILSAWFNAPWFFSSGAKTTTVDWTRRTCCSAVLADCYCDDIKHAMRHKADCFNTYCKNMPFSIKLCVYSCLHSIPTLTGEHLHLRITHKRHVCEYSTCSFTKKWSSLHGLSSLSFCRWGPVTPCIAKEIYILIKNWYSMKL